MGSFNVKVREDPKEFVQNYFIVISLFISNFNILF